MSILTKGITVRTIQNAAVLIENPKSVDIIISDGECVYLCVDGHTWLGEPRTNGLTNKTGPDAEAKERERLRKKRVYNKRYRMRKLQRDAITADS